MDDERSWYGRLPRNGRLPGAAILDSNVDDFGLRSLAFKELCEQNIDRQPRPILNIESGISHRKRQPYPGAH